MEVKLFVCAQSAVIDQGTGSLSLFNLIEAYGAPSYPLAIQNFVIAAILWRSPDEHDDPPNLRCKMHLEGQLFMDAPFKASFAGRNGAKVISSTQGMVVPNPGRLVVSLYDGDAQIATWPIEFNHIGQPQLQNTPT